MNNHPQTVGAEIHSLCNLMKRFSDRSRVCRELRSCELTDMQTRVIRFLKGKKNINIFQRDLEQEFSIRRPTASIMLQTMEAKGLIRKEPFPGDARLKKLVLTEKGTELTDTAEREIARFEELLIKDIPADDMDAFFRVTAIIRKNLEANIPDKNTISQEKGGSSN